MVASTNVPVFTLIALAFNCAVISSNRALSRPAATSAFRNRAKAVRSGVDSDRENPQNRRNELLSSRVSASFTSESSYQTTSSIALNKASGGQAGSPLAALEIVARCRSAGTQSITFDSASNVELFLILRKPERFLTNTTTAHCKPPSFGKGIESSMIPYVYNYPRTALCDTSGPRACLFGLNEAAFAAIVAADLHGVPLVERMGCFSPTFEQESTDVNE